MPGATRPRPISLFAAFLLLITLAIPAQAQIRLDLPVQPLAASLTAVGTLGHLNVMFDPSVVDGLQAPALKAQLSADDALGKLLSGTKLHAVRVDANTIRVVKEPPVRHEQTSSLSEQGDVYPPTGTRHAFASATSGATTARSSDLSEGPDPAATAERRQPEQKQDSIGLAEVVVTGTIIPGAESASPLTVITADMIRQYGFASVRDVLLNLPQNFGGGINDTTTISPSPADINNASYASSANLHGLGSGATLTLVNGRRLAPNGLVSAADLSLIPLSAIARIEVLTDGASALYGSDAVAGVVNIILKEDFKGFETSAQFGDVTRGKMDELTVSQTAGADWGSGHALGVYEYYNRDPLLAQDKPFSASLTPPEFLIPGQRRNSLFIHAEQTLTNAVSIFFDAEGSHQNKSIASSANPPFNFIDNQRVDSTSLAGGGDFLLSDTWTAHVSGTYGYTNNNDDGFYTLLDSPAVNTYKSELWSANIRLDGSIVTLPGGAWKAAFGATTRRESLAVNQDGTAVGGSRQVRAIFGETNVPLVGPGNSLPLVHLLTFDVAGRFERYSDFGNSFSPKVGISWYPVPDLKVRATWGRSFRAPELFELYEESAAIILKLNDPSAPTGLTEGLATAGGNPGLQPEKSTNWTAGFDFHPSGVPNLTVGATYWNVDYKRRIQTVAPYTEILQNASLYPSAIVKNPTASFLQQVIAGSGLSVSLVGPYSLSDLLVYVDGRLLNVAAYKTDGVDLTASYTLAVSSGHLTLTSDIAYVADALERTTQQSPTISRLDKVFYIPSVRGRVGAAWQVGKWSLAAFEHFVGSYTNDTVTPNQKVSAFPTTDATIAYSTNFLSGDTSFALSVRNAFDKLPPYVNSTAFYGGAMYGYDPDNADPIGRFITLRISHRW
jgi:iron complex outermembrane receptor protein